MSQDKSRFRTYLEVIASIVAVIAVAVPATIYLAEHVWAGPVVIDNPAPRTTEDAPVVPATTAAPPPGRAVFLDSLTPDTGSTNLGTLPRAAQQSPEYAHSVVIGCGTNNIGDQERHVTYILSGRYRSLRAALRPLPALAGESQVRVDISPDNHPKTVVAVDVNSSQDISVDLEDTKKVTIQVACELPGALVVLSGAVLWHI